MRFIKKWLRMCFLNPVRWIRLRAIRYGFEGCWRFAIAKNPTVFRFLQRVVFYWLNLFLDYKDQSAQSKIVISPWMASAEHLLVHWIPAIHVGMTPHANSALLNGFATKKRGSGLDFCIIDYRAQWH